MRGLTRQMLLNLILKMLQLSSYRRNVDVNKGVVHPVILGCVPLRRFGSRFFMQGTRVMVHQRNGVLVRRISYYDNRLEIREKGLNLELKITQL